VTELEQFALDPLVPQPLFSVASRSISAVKTAGRPSSARAGDGCGAARRPRAAAPAAPRSWRPVSDRAGQASRRAGRRSGRAGEGKRQIIMLHGCPFAHRRSSQARQTFGTPQPPQLIENLLGSPRRSTDSLNLPIQAGSSCKQPQGPCWKLGAKGGIEGLRLLPSLAVSGSPAAGNQAQHVKRQPAFAVAELDQRAVTANAAVDAGAARQRQILRGRA
jgi:hypothetical protein